MPRLVLKKVAASPGMETAYEVSNSVADKMIKDGKAIMLHDGIMREVEKVEKPKKKEAEYKTKDMKPVVKASKKG